MLKKHAHPAEALQNSTAHYLNIAPFIYCGLKPPVLKGRFAIEILTIALLCLRV